MICVHFMASCPHFVPNLEHADFFLHRDVVDDLTSTFPTMSFTHTKTSLRMVVGAGSSSSKLTNQLLADYASLDSRIPILGVAFRYWAQVSLTVWYTVMLFFYVGKGFCVCNIDTLVNNQSIRISPHMASLARLRCS